jgi:hypothetical protein
MKKVLNITNYEEKANQNHVSYHLIPDGTATIKKTNPASVIKDEEKFGTLEPLLVEMQNGASTIKKNSSVGPQKI